MANFTTQTVRSVRHEVRLETPTVGAELVKATRAAVRSSVTHRGVDLSEAADDEVRVTVEDDTIVIWWEENTSD